MRMVAIVAALMLALVAGGCAPKTSTAKEAPPNPGLQKAITGGVDVNPLAPANKARDAAGAANAAIDQQQQSVPTAP